MALTDAEVAEVAALIEEMHEVYLACLSAVDKSLDVHDGLSERYQELYARALQLLPTAPHADSPEAL